MRQTNSSGLLQEPLEIRVPALAESQTPNPGMLPFAVIDLYARKENYAEIYIKGVQVFANTVTLQELELIPLSEFPDSYNKSERFVITKQNL